MMDIEKLTFYVTKTTTFEIEISKNEGYDMPKTPKELVELVTSIQNNPSIELAWNSENASFCEASGDWSGTKAVEGSQTIQMNEVKTHTFTLTCQDSTGTKTATDSVTVNVTPIPPTVITLPAVVTY